MMISPIFVACFLLLVPSVSSAEVKCKSFPNRLSDLEERTLAVGNDPALSRLSLSTSEQRETAATLLNYISQVDGIVTNQVSESTGGDEVKFTTCQVNRNSQNWQVDVEFHFCTRGLQQPNVGCVTDLDFMPDGVTASQSDIFEAVLQRSEQLEQVAPRAARELNQPWAVNATRGTGFEYDIRQQACTFDFAGAIFVKGNWHLVNRITNAPREASLPTKERETIYEYGRLDGNGRIQFVNMNISEKVEGEKKRVRKIRTTMKLLSTGVAATAVFEDILPENNPAIMKALRDGEHQVQQAADATTPSNIAILALPLAMNLVPVALIADVNTIGMLIYALLTDVLTAVPLAVKGIEVLLIGFQRERAIITRISGGNLEALAVVTDANTTKAAEILIAECQATQDLKPIGITFLVVALLFMVGGVAAEYWAKAWVRRKRFGTKVVSDDGWEGSDSELGNGSAGGLSGPSSGGPQLGSPQAAGLILARSGQNIAEETQRRAVHTSRWGSGGSAGIGAVDVSERGTRRITGRERELAERSRDMDSWGQGGHSRWNGPDGYDDKIE